MIQYSRTYIRTDIQVPWWFNVALNVSKTEFLSHMESQYIDTGKCMSEEFTFSQDGLELTWTGYWNSEVDFNEYDADPVLGLYWASKDEYNILNGITKGPMTSNIV